MLKVAVFFGGVSCEHDVSVITGMLAVNLLRGAEMDVLPVYLGREGGMFTSPEMTGVAAFRSPSRFTPVVFGDGAICSAKGRKKPLFIPDVALNCCHGGMGEGGTLAALFDWYRIPSASPEMPVSAVFMNKKFSALAARGADLPVARSFAVREEEDRQEMFRRAKELGYPVIVKPCRLGSSIGISVAANEEELDKALSAAFRYDGEALVEEYFADKRDINCAAYRIGGEIRTSLCEEAFSSGDILSFEEKYGGGNTRNAKIPADIPEAVAEDIRAMTARLYDAFDCSGIVRADFIYAGGKAYFNELNTVPGSLACYLFGESLSDAKKLLASLVRQAAEKKREKKITPGTHLLDSDIFVGAKSCKDRKNLV